MQNRYIITDKKRLKDTESRQKIGAHRGGEYRVSCNILIFNMFSVVSVVKF